MSKSVLITGASHGVGKAAAKQLAQEGYRLYLNAGHDKEALEDLCHELDATMLYYDISSYRQVQNLFQEIGELDLLINNAGISQIGLLQDLSFEEWQRIIDTNLTSVFACCKMAIPLMLSKKEGKIINISSVWGEVGASCEVAYSASKGGINAFTKALAKELAPSNIQVNALSLGVVDTRMNACFDSQEKDALLEEIPSGRFASARDAAQMISTLASANNYLTGQIIRFDGGWI